MPVSPYDLTTVANAKIWTNATASATDDATLQRLVTAVSMQVINAIGRNPLLNMVSEVRNGNGGHQMFVRKFPIARFISLKFLGATEHGIVSYFGNLLSIPAASGNSFYGYNYTENVVSVMGTRFPSGLANVQMQYISGYTDTAFETKVLDNTTYVTDNAGTFIDDAGVFYANGTPLAYTYSATPSRGQYTFSYGNLLKFSVQGGGVYIFSPDDIGAGVVISYKYGKVPEDLEQIVIEAVSFLSMKRKSIGQISTNASGQRVTFMETALPPETLNKLETFNSKVPVV